MAADDDRESVADSGAELASEELLAAGIVAGEIGVWRWSVATGRLDWSRNLEQIHRLPPGIAANTFESFARDIHPDDRDGVMAEIRRVIETGAPYRVQYRLPPDAAGTIRWLEARGRLIRDASGKPVRMTGICQDITDIKRTEAELAVRARQHEAIVQLGEQALAGTPQKELFAEAVKIAAELVEADFAEVLELSQERDALILRAGFGWSDDRVGQPTATSDQDTQIGLTLRSAKPVVFSDIQAEAPFRLTETASAHDVRSGASVTIGGGNGTPFGVLAAYCKRPRCISPTDLRFLQSIANVLGSAIKATQDHERSELLIGELRHRVGNLFSLVQALHRQTGQSAHDARDLEMKFGARLAALASAHSLILEGGWKRTSLRSLLETTLAPYIERVSFTGGDARLPADSAFSFSMALHELATNANKYGALSGPDGRLAIECGSVPDALGYKAVLVWKEIDGPPPPAQTDTEGFGSRLIGQVVERQLGGQVARQVEPDGLRITIEFPIG